MERVARTRTPSRTKCPPIWIEACEQVVQVGRQGGQLAAASQTMINCAA